MGLASEPGSSWESGKCNTTACRTRRSTLTEVPILQGLIGNGMGKGPALALLLSGPEVSLPSMLVIRAIPGTRKTLVFVGLAVVMSTLAGYFYGRLFRSACQFIDITLINRLNYMLNIAIFRSGCLKCQKLAEQAEIAARELGLEYRIEKVTDIQRIAAYGIMLTPGLVVDGDVKSVGRLLSAAKIRPLLQG